MVGGTGMLARVVDEFVGRGRDVVVPSRRRAPAGRWVAADWTDPAEFVHRVATALDGAVPELVVLWCHRPHREPVAAGLVQLLDRQTRTVEVVGTSSWAHDTTWAQRHLAGSTLVALGQAAEGSGWLTGGEIADGVQTACDSAVAGRPAVHVVGFLPAEARRALPGGV